VEALAQRAVYVGVSQFAQQPADFVRSSPGLSDHPQSCSESDPASLRVFENAALENAALPRPIRVNAARTILAEGRARLRKASDRRLAAGNHYRQPQSLQFRSLVARFQFDDVEQRTVAA
jgi:hypothetical protein